MNTIAANEANGRHSGHGTGEEHTLTCGEQMDTEENMDSTRATLLEILEDRAARILENEKDISAVERVLAILDAKQSAGDEWADEAEVGAEEAEATDETDKVEEGTEATDEAEVTEPKPMDEETQEEPHTDSANLLSMPIDRLKEIAGDPEAAAGVFVQARRGEPLDCPGCGSSAHTKRSPGKDQRPDIFRCTPCKSEFGIKTGTVMHGSRETLGTWLAAIRLVADTGGEASGHDLSNLTGTGTKSAADMITAIRSEMGSPGGLLAAVARLKERAETTEEPDTGPETPDPETPT